MHPGFVLHREADGAGSTGQLIPVARLALGDGSVQDLFNALWRATQNTDGAWSLQIGSDYCPGLAILQPCYAPAEGFLALRSTQAGDLFVTPSGEPMVIGERGLEPLSEDWAHASGISFEALDGALSVALTIEPPPISHMLAMTSLLGTATRLMAPAPANGVASEAERQTHQRERNELARQLAALMRAAYVTAPDAQTLRGLLFLGDQPTYTGGLPEEAGPEALALARDVAGAAREHLVQLAQPLGVQKLELLAAGEALLASLGLQEPQPALPEIDWGW